MSNEIELENVFSVIEIPKNCVDIELQCKVMLGGELITVHRHLDLQEVLRAIKEAEDGYIPEEAVFTLTEKGKELARHLMEENDV